METKLLRGGKKQCHSKNASFASSFHFVPRSLSASEAQSHRSCKPRPVSGVAATHLFSPDCAAADAQVSVSVTVNGTVLLPPRTHSLWRIRIPHIRHLCNLPKQLIYGSEHLLLLIRNPPQDSRTTNTKVKPLLSLLN